MNQVDGRGRNAMHYAVLYGKSKTNTINQLHKLGCKLERTDTAGKTPLDYAIERRDDVSFAALCELHARINERFMTSPQANLPRFTANTITFLNEAKECSKKPPAPRKDMFFSINARDNHGKTALQYAIKENNEKRVAELLKQGAKFTTEDIYSTKNQRIKHLLLKELCRLRSIKKTNMLFDAVENMNYTTAAESLSTKTEDVVYLTYVTKINYRADINARNIYNKPPLLIALEKARNYPERSDTAKQIIYLLLENKANINARDNHGKTALDYAIETGDTSIVKEILKYQPNIDTTCNNNRTILHEAIEAGNIEILKILLSSGGNIHINAQGLCDKPKIF